MNRTPQIVMFNRILQIMPLLVNMGLSDDAVFFAIFRRCYTELLFEAPGKMVGTNKSTGFPNGTQGKVRMEDQSLALS